MTRSVTVVLHAVAMAAVVALGLAFGSVFAEPKSEAPVGSAVIVRDGSLWQVLLPPDKKHHHGSDKANNDSAQPAPVELLRLGDHLVTRITVSSRGDLVLIETDRGVHWAGLVRSNSRHAAFPGQDDPAVGGPTASAVRTSRGAEVPSGLQDGKSHMTELPACAGRAYWAPDGRSVACFDSKRNIVVHRLTATVQTAIHSTARGPHLAFLDSDRLVVSDLRGLWAVSIDRPHDRTLLAPHVPDGDMLVSPDGSRAVAVVGEGEKNALYVFRLDGKGIKRRLLAGAVPVEWSRNSEWVLAQMGRRACMVRARGGQYKCWRGFRAVAIAPDGSHILMARKLKHGDRSNKTRYDLFRGRRDGVKSEWPRVISRSVAGPAAWLPH
ncbi:MAG: hypothetical protein MJE77_01365 [Proteobacteria bacterium]|nr:hypothetical protein [Pseudomonadota bacterium]